MSKENFDSKKAILEAMDNDQIKSPNMPVDVALQEAEDLYVWCQDDKDMLKKTGLNWGLVTDLQVRTGACRYVQSEWQKDYRTLKDARREWKEKSPAAFDFRNELVHDFYFAFAKMPELYSRTQAIAKGNSNADMIQDLSDLAVLGNANKAALTAIGFDLTKLDKAAGLSEEMADLLAKSNEQKMKDNKLRILRDKAYTHMKEAVDEIRRCGQYAFWKDEQRYKGYVSLYHKKKSAKAASAKAESATAE